MSKIYYNEIEPFACFWLENLMADGFIAEGQIDNRSIRDIQPEDLEGYIQCHFFAGIGVWSYALRQAGWSDDRPIWTGSCPCQPFSQAGLHKGDQDDRHLWPEFHRLIKECRPSTITGEQVSGKGGFQFFDLLQSSLEKENYSATAVDLGAHSVGTTHSQGFHKRQRLYWVAEDLANAHSQRSQGFGQKSEQQQHAQGWQNEIGHGSTDSQHRGSDDQDDTGWNYDLVWCRDQKWRPVECGTFPMAHATPNRIHILKAFGNAIPADTAKIFIESYMESVVDRHSG